MADQRDVRTAKIPPAGVRAQSARESWDGDLTPEPAPPGTVSSSVRTELKSDIAAVKGDVAEVKGDVKMLGAHVNDMRISVAGINGKLDILPTLVKSLEHHSRVTFAAQVDVGKEQAISAIRDTTDARKTERRLRLKLVAIVGSIIAAASTLITLLASRC